MVRVVRGKLRSWNTSKPIVFNEDRTDLRNMKAALDEGVSWGYYDQGRNNYRDDFTPPKGIVYEMQRLTIAHLDSSLNRTICVVGDINGDGKEDVVIGSRQRGKDSLIWIEQKSLDNWQVHLIDDEVEMLEFGGFVQH